MSFDNVLPAEDAKSRSTSARVGLFQKAIEEGIRKGQRTTFVRFRSTEEEALALTALGYEVSVSVSGDTHLHWF